MAAHRPQTGSRRIVIVNDFADVRGGASSQAVKLARTLAENGWDVTFFSGAEPKSDIARVRHVSLGQSALLEARKTEAALNGLYNRRAKTALESLIRDHDTPETVYHVHGWAQVLSPPIFAALDRVSDRVVQHAHDFSMACPSIVYFNFPSKRICDRVPMSIGCVASNCDKRSLYQKVWRLARHAIYRRLARRIRKTAPIVSVHERMTPILRQGGAHGEISVVRNHVDDLLRVPVAAEQNKDIVFLGQLLDFKGVVDLARAAKAASSQLVVVGEGPDRKRAERVYPGARFVGWQAREAVGEYLSSARALVVPTRGIEPFGIVVVEAARCGVPVVVSDSVFLADQVRELEIGLTYPAEDVDALATALKRIATDDALVARMSRAGPVKAAALSPESGDWLARIEAVYNGRLGKQGARAEEAALQQSVAL